MSADHPHAPEPTRTGQAPRPDAPADEHTHPPADCGTVPDPRGMPTPAGTVAGSASAEVRAAALSSGEIPALRRVVPGFEVGAELGRGAMGVVYKARQSALNRTIALKMVLGGQYADPLARARFLVEAEAVAALDHPHVVKVYEFGQSELPFFAMEYVGGGTLAEKLRRGGRV